MFARSKLRASETPGRREVFKHFSASVDVAVDLLLRYMVGAKQSDAVSVICIVEPTQVAEVERKPRAVVEGKQEPRNASALACITSGNWQQSTQ